MDDSSPIDPASGGDLQMRLLRREPLRLRAWFIPLAALLATTAIVYYVSGQGTTAAGVAILFGYTSLACTFLPLPTAWIIIWAAAPAAGGGLGIPPLIVATIGALGTAVANMNDYYLLTFLYRYRPIQKIRMTGLYRRAAAWYNRSPFAALAAASFLPIPIDIVRLLAISEGYDRFKFVLGSLVGRWPRYLLFAILADRFQLGWQWVVGIAGATVVLGLWRGLPPLIRRVQECSRHKPTSPEETSP